ncbi:MAG: DNA starvation/stationary phase protection protein Dps [Chloroflexi bacterium OHK40]
MAATRSEKKRGVRTSVDIPVERREPLVALLNQHLADCFDLMSQTKEAHWNVKGPNFYQLHELFDDLAANLIEHIDTIAERVTALGGLATGTARMAAAASRLPEYPLEVTQDMEVVECLVERYAAYAAFARQAIDEADELEDKDTADLFTDLSRDLDKHLWFLEAHLQS